MFSIFRPRTDPARLLYDVFQESAKRRDTTPWQEWEEYELTEVWKAARDYAQMHRLTIPTMEQVRTANRIAKGHVDYGAKLAYYISDVMTGRV